MAQHVATLNQHTREIIEMLTYARPDGSVTEQVFVDRYLTPLGFTRDRWKNLRLEIANPDGSRPKVLFSSHMDTVARKEGIATVHYDGTFAHMSNKSKRQGFGCLGADDTAGIWLMMRMIRNKVPGVYVIHHAEESGGIGSSAIAQRDHEFLAGIDIALAFDRMGTNEIITHQGGRRTASQGFAWSLARQLGGKYQPSDAGTYTDTAEYADLVHECSNLSVGYYNQHTERERLDVPFLIDLSERLIACDWTMLNVERTAGEDASLMWGNYRCRWDEEDALVGIDRTDDRTRARLYDLEECVREFPDVAAELLAGMGITADDFEEAVYELTGRMASTIPF